MIDGQGKKIKWLKFLLYIRIPIVLFSGVFNLIDYLLVFSSWSALNLIMFSLFTTQFIVSILAFMHNFKKLTPSGYIFLMALLAVETVVYSFSGAMLTAGNFGSFPLALIICLLIAILVWAVPNYIYLRVRRPIFDLSPAPFKHTINLSAKDK